MEKWFAQKVYAILQVCQLELGRFEAVLIFVQNMPDPLKT